MMTIPSSRFLYCLLATKITSILAQSLTPSSSWLNPTITTPVADRISTANAAIQLAISNVTANNALSNTGFISFGIPGGLFAAMAEFDIASNQKIFQSQLTQFFGTVSTADPTLTEFEFLDYAQIYGYAALRAFAAYQDPVFLNYAVTNWNWALQYSLTPAVIAAGTMPTKNFTLSPICQSITMVGGVYWETDATNPALNGLGTGTFLVNSALLAEATSNQTYLNAAIQSANFFQSHLYNAKDVVQDGISARQNDSCSTSSLTLPYNSGLAIEGLSILASITRDANNASLLLDTIEAALSTTSWQGANGIISYGSGKTGDRYLLRALVTAYARNNTKALRDYLGAYISVQYNAILDQATVPGSNVYGSSWVGPPATTFDPTNQTISLTGLIGGIYIQNTSSSTGNGTGNGGGGSSGSSGDGGGGGATSSSSLAGPIAGGVVGGIAFLLIIAAGVFLYRRRQHKKMDNFEIDDPRPVPFVMAEVPRNPNMYHAAPQGNGDNSTTSGLVGSRTEDSLPAMAPQFRNEKRGYHVSSPSGSTSMSSRAGLAPNHGPSSVSDSDSRSQQSGSNAAARGEELPTTELVRLLNARLQPEQWNNEEVPPEYAAPPR